MSRFLLIIALICPLAEAGIFNTEHVQTYPVDWPPVFKKMSSTCREVEGSFVDPNRWRWEHEEIPGSKLGEKYGGTQEAAWAVFGLPSSDVRAKDEKIKSRTFTVSFDGEGNLTVSYLLDEKIAASNSFTKDKLLCSTDGLQIITSDRTGSVFDKLPNEGRLIARNILYRSGQFLYVKHVVNTKARIYRVIPQSFLNVTWFRFPAQRRGEF